MAKIEALRKDELSEAPATPGISRYLAFEGDDCLIIRSRSEPGTVSAWHHHGDYEVYGYIISGFERFDFGPGEKDSVLVGPGDFFHIQPNTIHRDVNPSHDERQEVVLFFRGTGPVVVNVDHPA
jgi:quercetin dioxygenase-like cupin family protein